MIQTQAEGTDTERIREQTPPCPPPPPPRPPPLGYDTHPIYRSVGRLGPMVHTKHDFLKQNTNESHGYMQYIQHVEESTEKVSHKKTIKME